MRWTLAATVLVGLVGLAGVATPSLADAPAKRAAAARARTPAPKAKATAATTATTTATATPAAKPACKKRVVGKGLDRKVVCEFEEEIVVTAGRPKPSVVIAPIDGRRVTGRPKLTDPLEGLSRRRTTH